MPVHRVEKDRLEAEVEMIEGRGQRIVQVIALEGEWLILATPAPRQPQFLWRDGVRHEVG